MTPTEVKYSFQVWDDADNREAVADMEAQADRLHTFVVGRKIMGVTEDGGTVELHMDDGTVVEMVPVEDCCSYSDVTQILTNPREFDATVTSVETFGDYERWYILADGAPAVRVDLDWSTGNYPYYPFGFEIRVKKDENPPKPKPKPEPVAYPYSTYEEWAEQPPIKAMLANINREEQA